MYDIIAEKMRKLASSHISDEMQDWIRRSSMWYWLYSDLKLQGIMVGKKEIVAVTEGLLQEETPLELYNYVHSYLALQKEMQKSIGMQESITPEMLSRWAVMLLGEGRGCYRTTNSPVYEWSYIPPHFLEIPDLLKRALGSVEKQRFGGSPTERAAAVMTSILRIRPFGDDSSVIARAAVLYTLFEEGFPTPMLKITEMDFNRLCTRYLENYDLSDFTDLLERNLLNRIDEILLFIQQDE